MNRGKKGGAPLRLWWRALSVKRPQAILALLSLMVGAAVISMLLNLYGGVRRKMTQEFRGYGANVVLAPGSSASFTPTDELVSSPRPCHPERSEGSLQFRADASGNGNCGDSSPAKGGGLRMTGSNSPDSPTNEGNKGWGGTMDQAVLNSVHEIVRQGQGTAALAVLYVVVRLERIPADPLSPDFVNVVAVGTDLAAMIRMNPGWRETHVAQALLPAASTDASRAAAAGKSARATTLECVVGSHLASRLRIAEGDTIHLGPLASFNTGGATAAVDCRLDSVLKTGSSEEDQVFLPLGELQEVMGMTGRISLIQLRLDGGTREIERSIREMSKALPGVDVRPIRQIVYSEGRVLGVIRWFLLAVTGLILVIIVICLTATMTAIALERRKDIGVMKALGASDFGVMKLFLAEGAALGATGGCIGFVIGSFWALGLAHRLFGVTLNVLWWTLPLVCGLATLLALAAAVFLVGVVRATQPAVVLKGD
ncbi:MAG: FtsX-like permease family protein [Terriglobia bacterium]